MKRSSATLLVLLLALSSASCTETQRAVIADGLIVCKDELVEAIKGDLDAPNWGALLNARTIIAGAQAVACAIQKIIDGMNTPEPPQALATLPLGPRHGIFLRPQVDILGSSCTAPLGRSYLNLGETIASSLIATRKARAEAWLATHRPPARVGAQ